jgi:3-oxoacyl-[acyl-carrier protein] reductase
MPWNVEEDEPQLLRSDLLQTGVRCEYEEIDQSRPEVAVELLDLVEKRLGKASILINNAAYSTHDGYGTLDAQSLDAHYAVNVRGTMLISVEFARRYPGGPGGRIVNMTSGQSIRPMPNELAYAASKGAIEAFTTSVAIDLAARGITVNAIDPGPTDSGWMDSEQGLKQALMADSPWGRVGSPEDAARVVAFLVSEAAAWVNGQVIHADGGRR